MSATSALLRGRQFAEEQMLDAVLIRRRTSETTDPDTGVVSPVWTIIYGGKAKIQQRSASASNENLGEAQRLSLQLEVHVPISETGPAADDQITVTAASLDTALIGRVFILRGEAHKTFATARRFTAEELTS